jgi:hypothetical protein
MSQSYPSLPLETDGGDLSLRRAQFEQQFGEQPDFVRALHGLLRGLEMLCYVIASVAFAYGLYETVRWFFTRDPAPVAEAWTAYGLSMSLLVLPLGLDVLLLRVFPTDMGIMGNQLDADKLRELTTGARAILFGIAITLCGLPGAVYMTQLAITTLGSFSRP